jgi:hypothetical protein
MKSFLKEHSLTIVLGILTIVFWIKGGMENDEWWSGFYTDLGHDCFSGFILFVLSYGFREKAKPED